MSYFKSLLGAHVAVFFMAMTGVLAKVSGFSPWHVTSYRVVLGGVVLLLALGLERRAQVNISGARAMACLAMGLLLSIHWYTFFKSLELLGVMLGYAMTGTQPILIALMAHFWLGERMTRQASIALFISLLGFLVLGFETDHAPHLGAGVATSLFSFTLFAALILFNRAYVQHTSSLLVTALEMVGAMPLTLVMTLPHWSPDDQLGWLYALVLGLLCTGFAFLLYNTSMKVLPAPTAGLLLSLEVVYGLLGGYLIGDSLSLTQTIAVLFIANIVILDAWSWLRYSIKKSDNAAS